MPTRIGQVVAVVVVAFALAAGGAWLGARGRGSPPPGSEAPPRAPAELTELTARVDRLRRELDLERAARERLESDLERLRGSLAAPGVPLAEAPDQAPEPGEAERVAAAPPHAALEAFDPELLVSAGFPPRDVEAFRSRLDAIEMERLYLRDQATREGWLESPRFREESRGLADQRGGTRAEFGDALYDWYLYSAGRPNRVEVVQVFEGSPAERAGLRAGDVIERYDERSVLSSTDLRDATTAGRAGETTPVDVDRGGEEIRLYLPRGPLGIRMHPTAREPEPPR